MSRQSRNANAQSNQPNAVDADTDETPVVEKTEVAVESVQVPDETEVTAIVTEAAVEVEQATEAAVEEQEETLAEAPVESNADKLFQGLLCTYGADLKGLIKKVFETEDTVAKAVIQDFDSYAFEMARGRSITGPEAAMNQMKIFRAIQSLILNLDENFNVTFAAVLKMIEEAGEYGVFSGAAVYRFGDISRLRTSEQEAYLDIWNLLIVIAPVKGRKHAIGLVDLNRPFRQAFSDLGKRRVLAFLGM